MKIDQLIYFVETAKQEHIGKASKILGISPSAISHSIRSLEGELGLELFQKQGKFIALTDEGRRLLERSEDLIGEFRNLKYDLLNETDDSAYYKIGASHTISATLVAKAWGKLSKNYNETKIDLLTLRSSDVIKGVLEKHLDIGVLFSPQEHPEIDSHLITSGQLYICVNKDHPIFKIKASKRLQALSDYPSVLPKAFSGIDICVRNPMFEKFNINVNPKTLTDSYDVAISLIKNSNYWAFIPEYILEDHKKDLKIIKPTSGWDAPYNISMIWNKRRFIPQFYHDLKALLK